MKTQQTLKILLVTLISLTLVSCNKKNDRTFGIFKVNEDNTTIEMNGIIKKRTLKDFNKLHAQYPKITTINIKNCEGSMDDETNLKLSKKIHQLNLNTHLLDNAEISSGGVDFFLAGKKRTRDKNTRVGVHSWATLGHTATDYPEGHSNHQPYIDYYIAIGFSETEAKDFYYFTINAASAKNIHWMDEDELKKYKIFTE